MATISHSLSLSLSLSQRFAASSAKLLDRAWSLQSQIMCCMCCPPQHEHDSHSQCGVSNRWQQKRAWSCSPIVLRFWRYTCIIACIVLWKEKTMLKDSKVTSPENATNRFYWQLTRSRVIPCAASAEHVYPPGGGGVGWPPAPT